MKVSDRKMCGFSYVTAHTDTEEEELGEEGEARAVAPGDTGERKDELTVLLEQADSLHDGSELEKEEGLAVLLGKKEEVGKRGNCA